MTHPFPSKIRSLSITQGRGTRNLTRLPFCLFAAQTRRPQYFDWALPEGQPNNYCGPLSFHSPTQPIKGWSRAPWYHSRVCSLSCSFLAALCIFLRFPKLRQGRIDSQLDLTVVWLPERQINILQVSLGCCQRSVWVPITTNQDFAKHILQYLHMN